MRSELDETRVGQLEQWAMNAKADVRTQRDLATLWKLRQGTVSAALANLGETGYVIAHPRQGNNPIHYTLAGKSRLAIGIG